ncbi:MAG: dihydroorotate dehydrogenase-like protein [Bacteroidales bacterium]|jgi:dihydroorotate dehydrogenase (fumarate)|nr:dihydroorotate dehydrogenase-like protein [Bacteroidales bacterium]
MDLSTTYLGLRLKTPFIVASSELTDSVEKIMQHEKNGAGAVVLKSMFEEQILAESYTSAISDMNESPDAFDYIQQYQAAHSAEKHLKLIEEAKKSVSIPIIASINCVSKSKWIDYTKSLETAGADAIELNISFLPTDMNITGEEIEQRYIDIVQAVKQTVKIPVSLKLSPWFSSLPNMLYKFYIHKIDGFVLFNKFYHTDVNINTPELSVGSIFSDPGDFHHSLRYIGLMSGAIKADFAASTGIHTPETAIKLLLAGAKAVELASILYKKGSEYLLVMKEGLEKWMEEKNYSSLEEAIGICSFKNIKNPNGYSRIQFMKYFAKIQ